MKWRKEMRAYRKTAEAISKLSPEQYRVTQQNGTEAPGIGELAVASELRKELLDAQLLLHPNMDVPGCFLRCLHRGHGALISRQLSRI